MMWFQAIAFMKKRVEKRQKSSLQDECTFTRSLETFERDGADYNGNCDRCNVGHSDVASIQNDPKSINFLEALVIV